MKKVLLPVMILLLFCVGVARAQVNKVQESFAGGIFPPAGWTLSNSGNILSLSGINSFSSSNNVGSLLADFFNVSSGSSSLSTPFFTAAVPGDSVRFSHAHAHYQGWTAYDSMFIETSLNGTLFTRLVALGPDLNPVPPFPNTISTASPVQNAFVPGSNQWGIKAYALPTGTIQVRFTFASGFGNKLYIDDIIVDSFFTAPQVFDSCTSVQAFSNIITKGIADQVVLKIPVYITGNVAVQSVAGFQLNTSGCTNAPSDLDSAKIYFTGSSTNFSTVNRFGGVPSPSGSYTISGNQPLANGVNYFWLTYDLKKQASIGNLIDAGCTSITANSIAHSTLVPAPTGVYTIALDYDFDTTTNQNFTTAVLTGPVPNEWQKGIPVNVGPAGAFSAPNCWGTNLSGNYTIPSSPDTTNYALITPLFMAKAPGIQVGYKEWYYISSFDKGVFQYRINSGAWISAGASVSGTSGGWQDKTYTVNVSVSDTIRFRWNFTALSSSAPAPGWYIDQFAVTAVDEIDIYPPDISYTPLENTALFTNRLLPAFATITDMSSVDTSTYKPAVYYKKTSDNNAFGANNNTFNGWKHTPASNNSSPFSFVIDYSLLRSAPAIGDTLQYFIVAQDLAPVPNMGAIPATGFSGTNTLNIVSAPAAPNRYIFTSTPLNGNYTVGAGQSYTTLTQAINDLDLRGVSGPVTFSLTDNSYAANETFPLSITNFPGSSAANKVTIKPAASNNVTITGNADAVILFNEAGYVTIDGSNNGTSSMNLVMENPASAGTNTVVQIRSNGVGCHNVSIANCMIRSGSGNNADGYGIFAGGASIGSAGDHNDTITILHDSIYQCGNGIVMRGSSVATQQTVILNNVIGHSDVSRSCHVAALLMDRSNNATIENNMFMNVVSSTNNTVSAVIFTQYNTNLLFNRNRIVNVQYTGVGGYGAKGLVFMQGTGNSNITVSNNYITGVVSDGNGFTYLPAFNPIGMSVEGGSGYHIYYNTIEMNGDRQAGNAANAISSCLYAGAGASGLDIRNNIFQNKQTSSRASGAGTNYCVYSDASPAAFTQLNYNDLFDTAVTAAVTIATGYLSGTNQPLLSDWMTATGKESSSVAKRVLFTSAADLHIAGTSIGDYKLKCLPVGGITTDLDGQARNATWHYMGADENTGAPLPVTLSTFTATRSGNSVLLVWSTASENNNSHFIIERSLNSKDFDAIGKVAGKGSSTQNLAYQYLDDEAGLLTNNGTVYYRLLQVDADARSTPSAILSVDFSSKKQHELLIFPNPFTGNTQIFIDATENKIFSMSITDLHGRVIGESTARLAAGRNIVTFPGLNNAEPGIYLLKATTENDLQVYKLVKE